MDSSHLTLSTYLTIINNSIHYAWILHWTIDAWVCTWLCRKKNVWFSVPTHPLFTLKQLWWSSIRLHFVSGQLHCHLHYHPLQEMEVFQPKTSHSSSSNVTITRLKRPTTTSVCLQAYKEKTAFGQLQSCLSAQRRTLQNIQFSTEESNDRRDFWNNNKNVISLNRIVTHCCIQLFATFIPPKQIQLLLHLKAMNNIIKIKQDIKRA